MVNPFASRETAALYARGRPDHHPRTVERAAALLGISNLERALDVACGPGLSTAALRAIADEVIGVDVVPEMVEVAAGSVDAGFVVASAEQLPFGARRFGLVAVASAVHWFDQDRFFTEARRVLDRDGVVAITDHFFLGEMENVDAFAAWMREVYADRYPTPPRGRHLSVIDESPAGFEVLAKDGWVDPIAMDRDALVDYLLTQSNTIAVVDAGRESRSEVRSWLRHELVAFFDSANKRTLRFWGSAACYR